MLGETLGLIDGLSEEDRLGDKEGEREVDGETLGEID